MTRWDDEEDGIYHMRQWYQVLEDHCLLTDNPFSKDLGFSVYTGPIARDLYLLKRDTLDPITIRRYAEIFSIPENVVATIFETFFTDDIHNAYHLHLSKKARKSQKAIRPEDV